MTATDHSPTTILPARNHFASHGHHRLAYELVPAEPHGAEDDAPTLVLLHALLAGRAEFAALRDLLRGRANLILPDARGHGASAAIPDQRYTIPMAASELDAILDAARVRSAHLLGHDLGSAVALAYAVGRPERIRSLSLIDPALPNLPTISDPDGDLAAAIRADARAADTAYKGVTERAVDQYLAPRLGPDWRAATPKPLVGIIRRHGAALAGCLSALSAYTPDPASLARLDTPTTVLTTAGARPVARAINAHLATLIPDAILTDLPAGDSDGAAWPGLDGAAAAAIVETFSWLGVER